MSNILPFRQPPQDTLYGPGNGALEALRGYFAEGTADKSAQRLPPADHLLIWLWTEGFKIVRLEGGDG